MPTAQLNGIDIYYEEHGSGDPLLLIMGFGGHSLAWIMQVPALAKQFRVITLDHLDIERAHVVGWSMGGMIAQELALGYPQKVDRLVLLASVARTRPYAENWLRYATQSAELVKSGALDPTGALLGGMPWMFTPAFLSQPDLVQAAIAQSLADPFPPTPEGIAAQAEACRAHAFGDVLDRLTEIAAPTLVLVGAEDILTPAVYSREMAGRIPGARLQILEKGGHGMPLEHPQQVNDALLAFLAEPAAVPSAAVVG